MAASHFVSLDESGNTKKNGRARFFSGDSDEEFAVRRKSDCGYPENDRGRCDLAPSSSGRSGPFKLLSVKSFS